MTKTGFFKTVKAFSCAAALAAGLFASAALSSCSNLEGDDFSPATQTAPAGTAPGTGSAPASLKMGSVSGTIQQKEEQPTVARSVVPTAADVTGGIISYTVSAWGTKADGTVVPETSPITVDTTTTTFSLGLEYGTWTLRADAKDTSSNIIMTQTAAAPITLDDSNPVVNLNFALDYAQISGTPGALSLTMAYATSVSKISYSLLKSDGTTVASGVVNPAPASSLTLNASQDSALGSLEPGDYQLVVEFLATDSSVLMRMDQAVQIYSNITTNKIDGVAPYINSGAVNVSADVIKKYQQSVVYVGGTGIGSGTAASDSNNGTQFDPVEHVERALEIIEASMLTSSDVPDGFKVFVQADTSLTGNLALSSSKKISIVGTNTSAYYKISGALTNGITASADDVSFSYINFNKVKGFKVTAGQTNLTNCKITNGVKPAASDGGAGICVDVGGAKAVLTNCVISGCVSDGFGGAIHVAVDSGSGTAQVDLLNCVIGQESTSCATDSAYSNYAQNGGGGINIGSGGKAVLNNTKVLYNGTKEGNGAGGGIRCALGGVLEITGGQINHNYAGYGGGGIFIYGSASSVTINGCAIGELSADATATGIGDCGNYSADQGGGGIDISSGTLTTTSGFSVIKNYSGGSSAKGGGVYIGTASSSDASATLVDTTISYNATSSSGGGVNVANSATLFSMTGGAINNNKAAGNGGGLSVDTIDGASQNFKNVQVKDNEATGNGGGIQITNGHYLTVSGSCDISGNKAANGGGVYASGTLKFLGGTISGNAATNEGGGVFVNGGKMFMSGDAVIGDKSAESHADENHHSNSAANGGGISIDKSTVYLGYISGTPPQKDDAFEGGIYYNYASGSGGGISMNDESANKLYCYKGTIDKNCGRNYGGAVSAGDSGQVQISKTAFNQNIAGFYGGAISIGSSNSSSVEVALEDATVEKNTVAKYDEGGCGGAIYAWWYDSLTISGSTYIPAGDKNGAKGPGKNDVWLSKEKKLLIGSVLSADTTPVATITPEDYAPGTVVLGDALAGTLVESELSKFAVTPDSSGESWTIGKQTTAGSTVGVLSTATIYVDGTATSEGSGSKASPCKTVATALTKVTAPNCAIIVKNGTTEAASLEIPAAYPGLTIKSEDTTKKTITGTSSIDVNFYAAATVSNIAFSNWGGFFVNTNVATVELENVAITDGFSAYGGGGLWLGNGAKVTAQNLTIKDCSTGASGGGIFVNGGANLSVDGLVMQGCHADSAASDGGGISNSGTVSLRQAKITGCTAGRHGAGIFNANNATLILDSDCDIPSGIYLTGGDDVSATAAKPLYIKGMYFGLADGASKIPLEPEIRSGAGNDFQENSVIIKGWEPAGGGAYEVTEDQVNCFVTSGTALGLEYDGTAAPHCGKLVDKSIAGGIKINVGGNITFEVATPSSSGEKARFNVLDSSVTPPAYITLPAGSAQIKILQYGSAIYSADAQEVAAAYLSEGNYELYCKAVIGGVTYDTTIPFGAGGKYTPLTLEAAAANAKVTFTNRATGDVTFKKNGGALETIASGDSAEITLDNIGDKVQFFGDNTTYGTSTQTFDCSNISCTEECYVYGNIMSLVKSDDFASEDSLMGNYTFACLFYNNAKIKNKTGYALLLPATTLTTSCYSAMFYGCSLITAAPDLPATTLKNSCYKAMFQSCKNLATAPALPAETLATECYKTMFQGCSKLTTAPELPATTLASSCYEDMFKGCTSLTTAPELPATTLANECYKNMFNGCTSLATAPVLPATTLANECYYAMFHGCTSLATAPALPATTLATYCYAEMFKGCSSLTTAPELKAAVLAGYCYEQMFKGCTNLNSVTCLATNISASDCTTDWLDGVAATGTFTKAAGIGVDTSGGWTSNSASGIPAGWTVVDGGGGVPAGFVVVEGSTVVGGDKFKVGSNAGVFVSGRSVAISTFWICDHEVTQAEYQAVMGTNPSNFKNSPAAGETQENRPVETVSWYDALVYCNKKSIAEGLSPCYTINDSTNPSDWGTVPTSSDATWNAATCDFTQKGYRLPTEAEWECAARGGKAGCEAANPTDWAGTDSEAELGKYAWYSSNSDSKTHEVKTEKQAGVNNANSLGLYDMSGNVLEWCWDWYNSSATINDDAYKVGGVVTNPAGASSGFSRVSRGGGWDDDANLCSVASRGSTLPNYRSGGLGFRVVRTAP